MVQEAEVPRCGMIAKITVTSFKSIENAEAVSKTARFRNDFMTGMQALPPSEERGRPMPSKSLLSLFHPPVRAWFDAVFPAPTRPQQLGWPAIARGESTLILAPTGTDPKRQP